MTGSASWRTERPRYSAAGLTVCGERVVARAERPLQAALAQLVCKFCSPGVRLLETGYGLGLTQSELRTSFRGEHWLIEGNRSLASRARRECGARAIVVWDTWEHFVRITPSNHFRAVLFDPYVFAHQAQSDRWLDRFSVAARAGAEDLPRILEPGGVLAFIHFAPHARDRDLAIVPFVHRLTCVAKCRPDALPAAAPDAEVWLLRKPASDRSGGGE